MINRQKQEKILNRYRSQGLIIMVAALFWGSNLFPQEVATNTPPVTDAGVDQTVILAVVEHPWTPAYIAPFAWYDANDTSSITATNGAVSQWSDKSGNGKHAVQTTASRRPSYQASDAMVNGLPSIGNGGTTGQIGLDVPALPAKTVYAVTYYKDGVDSTFDGYSTLLSGPEANGQYRVMGALNSANLIGTYNFNDAGTYKNGSSTSSTTVLGMGASVLKFKSSALRTQSWALGYNQLSADRDWQGAYCEVIFTDGAEDAATQAKIEGYLAHKWGLVANLPAGHPYKNAAPTTTPVAPATVMESVNLANDYWMDTYSTPQDNKWSSAAYFSGAMELLKYESNTSVSAYIERWGDNYSWTKPDTVGKLYRPYWADDQLCGQTYVDFYINEGSTDAAKTNSIVANLTTQIAASETKYWFWVDSLYMAMPTFGKVGVLTGNTNFFNAMHTYFTHARSTEGGQGLYDETRHLWFRDKDYLYPAVQAANGEPVFWSRGNGWAFAALARVLTDLPAGATGRTAYETMFTEMAAKLITIQQPNGGWASNLLDPNDPYNAFESSGTAFFVFGLAWGINNGLLDQTTYEPYVTAGWEGLLTYALRANGMIGYVQPVGFEPGTADSLATAPYAVGAFIQAGIEIDKMQAGVTNESESTATTATATLDGTVSDADGDAFTTTWSVVSGPAAVTFANLSAVDTTATFTALGTYILRLTADDTVDQTSDDVVITVTEGSVSNIAPVANASADQSVTDMNGDGSESVTLNGTGSSDPDGTITSYVWTEGAAQIATDATTTVTLAVGVHTITLTVTDNKGATASDTVVVTVKSPRPPVVAYGAGAESLSETSAMLRGVLTTGDTANAWICWGVADGGPVSTGDWEHVVSMGVVSEGVAFSNLVMGLSTNTTYFYRCYAMNPYGSDWSDTAQTFNGTPVGGGVPWTPADITVSAWFDAADASTITESGGAVSQWADKSGHGVHVTQSTGVVQPITASRTIGGLNAISFYDGSAESRLTNGTGTVDGDVCIFAVAKPDTIRTTFDGAIVGNNGSGTAKSRQYLNDDLIDFGGTSLNYSISSNTTYILMGGVIDQGDSSTQEIYVNGSSVASGPVQRGIPGSILAIGNHGSADDGFDGLIGEVIILNAFPSDADRQKLEGYLAHKWKLTANLPTNHPYKNTAPGGAGAIANQAPTGISDSTATLNARLNALGTNYAVTVYYGTSDGGTNATSWDTNVLVGSWTNVTTNISHAVNSLLSSTRYSYTFAASNASGVVWTSPSWAFKTPAAAQLRTVTVNHAVPYVWLSARNASWSTNYEAAALADADGDGFLTWQEYWAGTDPLVTASHLKIDSITVEGANIVIRWQHATVDAAIPPLAIQSTTNLNTGPWLNVGFNTPTNGVNLWAGIPGTQQLFYKLAVTNTP